uniref:Uncharacterized protein n=1 Tax=Setaria italica TaxID=4555 RepID=K3Z2U5_SETIT
MFPMLTGFISYGQQTIRAARYIGQDLPLVDWRFEKDIKRKQLLNYSIDFGVCIFVVTVLNTVRQIVYR